MATQPKSVGLAHCTYDSQQLQLEKISTHRTWPAIDREISAWISQPSRTAEEQPPTHPPASPPTTLLALDAPLGWPERLADTLHGHRAGDPVPKVANELFRRRTDDVVAAELGKRPLDVGADRIARTAHAALHLLTRLRETHALDMPLAWTPGRVSSTSMIEVYPAGTLASRHLPSSGYKGASDAAVNIRQDIIRGIRGELALPGEAFDLMSSSDHLLDAVLCCIAARDFADARVIQPNHQDPATKEGWIWVAPRAGTALQQTPR
jgi:hypothetical protein